MLFNYKALNLQSLYCYLIAVLLLLTGCNTHRIGLKKQARLYNQVWVITGASSGLGRGIALEAGRAKARIALAARNEQALQQVADKIRALGGAALVLPTDVSDSVAVRKLMEATLAQWGHIDVWVNNAGVTAFGRFTEVPLSHHQRVLQVNTLGTLYGSYVAGALFQEQGYGQLINIASAESTIPTAYQASYAASKAAIKHLGIVLRQEFRLMGKPEIKIVTVDPWALNTPIWDHAANFSGKAFRMTPMDRTSSAVNAVIRSAVNGYNKEVKVGWKTAIAYTVHRLLPRFTYRAASNIMHHQVEKSPEAPKSSGNLFQPSANPAVESNIKERIKKEKKLRKEKKKNRVK